MAALKASELVELKNAIRSEMARRDGYGSLKEYTGTNYEFSKNPAIGDKIKPEYGQKTIDLVLRICDYGDLKLVKEDDPIPNSFNRGLIDFVNSLAGEQKTGDPNEHSSCRSYCTGLCAGSCYGLCNGCTNCTASCGTGCETGCNGGCTGGCWKDSV